VTPRGTAQKMLDELQDETPLNQMTKKYKMFINKHLHNVIKKG
jgi:hypothetical protein